MGARRMLPYAYVSDNPLGASDPNGLMGIVNGATCPSFAESVQIAKQRAGCKAAGGNSAGECSLKLHECDVCDLCTILDQSWMHWVEPRSDKACCPAWDPTCVAATFYGAFAYTCVPTAFCDADSADELADLLFHEAIHGCYEMIDQNYPESLSQKPEGGFQDSNPCSAWAVEQTCFPDAW